MSEQLGAHERHLQRKQTNPLFADHPPSPAAWEQARRNDQQQTNAFLAELQQALQEAGALEAQVDSEVILDFKERLERLYVRAMSLGGDLNKHRQALLKLLEITMTTLERGAADDPVALQKLEDEREARAIYFRLLQTPLVADLMRGDEIIQAEELIPTLLGEDEDSVAAALELFEPEQLQALAAEARRLLAEARDAPPTAPGRAQQIVERAGESAPASH